MVSRVILIGLMVSLGACTSGPGPVQPQPQPAPESRERMEQTEGTGPSSAAAGLLQRAEDARRAADYPAAESLLRRAQRIDPRNAAVYLEYAELHQAMGEPVEARTMAERGLLYCSGRSCAQLRSFLP